MATTSSILDVASLVSQLMKVERKPIDKLNATLQAIFAEPEFRKKWEAIGTPVVAGSAAAFGELIRRDATRLGKLVKDAAVTVD